MGHEMRERAFWAAIHPPGLSGCSKQLEGGFSPLMWKGRHYCDDDDAVPSLPQFPFPFLSLSPLIWFNGLALRRRREGMIRMRRLPSFLALGIFLTIMNPLSTGVWFSLIDSVPSESSLIASHICFRLVMPSSSFSHLPTQTCNLRVRRCLSSHDHNWLLHLK